MALIIPFSSCFFFVLRAEKTLHLGPQMSYLGVFRFQFLKTIVETEISTLEFWVWLLKLDF